MRVYLATDHAGFELKKTVKELLIQSGHEVIDEGSWRYDENDDYTGVMKEVGAAISNDKDAVGIIFGGSGQGEAMTANRFKGVRAAVYYGGPMDIVSLSREHNDANVLSLGARFLSEADAKKAVLLWLDTKFSGMERHVRRIMKMDEI